MSRLRTDFSLLLALAALSSLLTACSDDEGGEESPDTPSPPEMIAMPEGFRIDRTEVTQGAYEAWLATTPPLDGQPPECSFNDAYEPPAACAALVCSGADCENRPQVCIDWCDALAYCVGQGKRLCGKIGGGSNAPADYANPTQSEWFAACSQGGNAAYPYGNDYQPDTCVGEDTPFGCVSAACEATDVGSFPECGTSAAGYDGVLDLSGNVMEWDDSCDDQTGPTDLCLVRGGSFAHNDIGLRCDQEERVRREGDAWAANAIGFRCCAD